MIFPLCSLLVELVDQSWDLFGKLHAIDVVKELVELHDTWLGLNPLVCESLEAVTIE